MKTPLILLLTFILSYTAKAQLFVQKNAYTHADTLRGSLTPLRSCYDINFYHLDVKFDIDKRFISGSNKFKFTAVSDFRKLQFDLYDNLKIEKVIYHGNELPYSREYNAVFITFPDTIRKGIKDEFTVFYSGHPIEAKKAPMESGVVFAKDSLGNPFVATACESKGASIWWPNKDHLSDEVDSMLISISVPNDLKEVSNGRLRKVTDLKNGYSRYDWFVNSAINNYNVAVDIGKYTHFEDQYRGESGNLTLDYWVLPYNLSRAKIDFAKNVKPMLAAYEYWFGPYPFYKDGYKLVETPYPAMEHQSAISYGGYLIGGPKNELIGVNGGTKWDFVIVHESAHEWFGNSITAKDLADLWIHEAFASYAQSLFVEKQYGRKAGQEYIYKGRSGISNDAPIVAAHNVNQMGSGDMYSKGSVLLNMIRMIINDDEKWRSILRGLNQTFYHRTVTYDQVVDYINEKSGKNVKPIFDQYLLYKDIPTLELKEIDGKLNSRWIASDKYFDMPLLITTPNGKQQFIFPLTQFMPLPVSGISKENIVIDTFNYYFNRLPD
ncbi:M1 family metallopeptidase [Pedobacter sp. L105]|uniref:M1 family metallopeptidase n=1 Tax=Pedobacter sp. L105 TaxID=1641871 RepID=UPI00131E163D|nr:M1 family metallopeptidase [Pedobacter sp. L105]